MKNLSLIGFILMLFLASCSEKEIIAENVEFLCLNRDGIIVNCEDIDNPNYFIENFNTDNLDKTVGGKKYYGGSCVLPDKPNVPALECYQSNQSNCANAFNCTECVNCPR